MRSESETTRRQHESLDAAALAPRVVVTRQFVPTVQGNCEIIAGDTPAELADRLVARLREDKVLQ